MDPVPHYQYSSLGSLSLSLSLHLYIYIYIFLSLVFVGLGFGVIEFRVALINQVLKTLGKDPTSRET